MARPTIRGFTIAEKRSLAFEKFTLYGVLFVAIIATGVSFVALHWVATEWLHLNPYYAAPGVPLAIDGFAIMASVGIVRSQTEGRRWTRRVSEWIALGLAVGLSMVGNVYHAFDAIPPEAPRLVVGAFASALPVIIAFSVHLYCRAIAEGISAKVMVDDPTQIVAALPDQVSAPRPAAPRAPRTAPARTSAQPTPAPARTAERPPERRAERAPITAQPDPAPAAQPAAQGDEHTLPVEITRKPERLRLYREMERLVADGADRPNASAIHDTLALTCSKPNSRRWVASDWDLAVQRAGGTVQESPRPTLSEAPRPSDDEDQAEPTGLRRIG